MKSHRPYFGFLMIDLAVAIAIVTALTLGLAMAVHQQQRGLRDIRFSREAVNIAERVLADLQATGRTTIKDEQARISVQRLDAEAPTGRVWVRVEVRYERGGAALTGLAPLAAVEGGR